ncbi:MAG TPA: hypothetical protein ENK18_24645 [Deltaproteobacteria bacterium]|nr:hypothetical protein [Deltaproteobacteria bacterium]
MRTVGSLWAACGQPAHTTVDWGSAIRWSPVHGGSTVLELGRIRADPGDAPATLIGWKLHGLAEWGRTRWRPKDLLDLWRLLRSPHLGADPGPPILAEALRIAFSSRGYDPVDASKTLGASSWGRAPARARWRQLQRRMGPDVAVPDLAEVRVLVSARLAPAPALIAG